MPQECWKLREWRLRRRRRRRETGSSLLQGPETIVSSSSYSLLFQICSTLFFRALLRGGTQNLSNNKMTFANMLSLSQILHTELCAVNRFLYRWHRFGKIHKIGTTIFLFPQENCAGFARNKKTAGTTPRGAPAVGFYLKKMLRGQTMRFLQGVARISPPVKNH
jgi:hypothetical protein